MSKLRNFGPELKERRVRTDEISAPVVITQGRGDEAMSDETARLPSIPEEDAERLASETYEPHRFGDCPAWFSASVKLAHRCLTVERDLRVANAKVADAAKIFLEIDKVLEALGYFPKGFYRGEIARWLALVEKEGFIHEP